MLLSPSQWESMTQWKPLAVFFLLAYLFSAICWIAAAYVPSEDLGPVIMLLGVLGPMLAAYIVSKKTQTTSEFWRSTFHYKLHYKWYVAGVGVPLVVLSILLLICYTIGDNINTDEVLPLWTFPLIFLFMALIGGGYGGTWLAWFCSDSASGSFQSTSRKCNTWNSMDMLAYSSCINSHIFPSTVLHC
ncbi:hypothetical protein GEMRC1_005652 [Eukaryota sp. GEM-RC1]